MMDWSWAGIERGDLPRISRIGGWVMDWHWIGELVNDWHLIDQLVVDWQSSRGLALEGWIGPGFA